MAVSRAGHQTSTSKKKGQCLQQMAFTAKASPMIISRLVFRLPEQNLGPFQQEHIPYPQQEWTEGKQKERHGLQGRSLETCDHIRTACTKQGRREKILCQVGAQNWKRYCCKEAPFMYEVLKPEDGRGTAAKIERGTAAKTYLFLYEVLKLEEVLLQQRQACLVEALHGRRYFAYVQPAQYQTIASVTNATCLRLKGLEEVLVLWQEQEGQQTWGEDWE
ncbi:MAG: hypothetical protein FRX49_12404 [Trebouxia sp. A1-2]|nr:MAG: hypothetical protein FRX49_12404 [Trebouxia sp. A1-2]